MIGKQNNSQVFGSNKVKGHKQDSQNRVRSPIPEGRKTLVLIKTLYYVGTVKFKNKYI